MLRLRIPQRHAPSSLLLAALAALAVTATLPASGDDASGRAMETATFSMYCYWTGEATLGRVDGVVASRIGHWGGAEIVQVDYDPSRTDVAALTRALERQDSLYAVVAGDDSARRRLDGDLEAEKVDAEVEVFRGSPRFIEAKHTLRTRHPELYALDLTEEQAIALNTWSYFGGAMPEVLDDAQKARLAKKTQD